jgi:4-hydroxybenzoate polyprenyltransferase
MGQTSNFILGLVRWDHWGESKLPFALWCGAIGFMIADFHYYKELLSGIYYTTTLLAFGYTFNDLCDYRLDADAGKQSALSNLGAKWRFLPSTIFLFLNLLVILSVQGSVAIWMIVGLVITILYSIPFIRLKEKGVIGIVAGSIPQWSVPALVFAQSTGTWFQLWPFVMVGALLGSRHMLIHQLVDRSGDLKTGQQTLGANLPPEYIILLVLLMYLPQRPVFLIFLLIAFVIVFVSERISRDKWDRNFNRVSLSFFYLVLGPMVTYTFLPWEIMTQFLVLHVLLVDDFLWGELQRNWYHFMESLGRC